MAHKLTIYGCRGSIPTPEPEFMKYGGNTSNYVIRTDDNDLFFLDAGSGIKKAAAKELTGDEKNIYLVMSHAHFDHIIGLGMSRLPFYNQKTKLITSSDTYHALYESHGGSLFPVSIAERMPGIDFWNPREINYFDSKKSFTLNNTTLDAMYGLHPNQGIGGSILYRFNLPRGISIIYATDTEFDFTWNNVTNKAEPFKANEHLKEDYLDLIRNADILIADAAYSLEQYNKQTKGFGHSYPEQILDLANKSNIKEVILTHHDPDHNDTKLDEISDHAKKYSKDIGFSGKVTMAQEGLERLL